jgi:hypothetical protein
MPSIKRDLKYSKYKKEIIQLYLKSFNLAQVTREIKIKYKLTESLGGIKYYVKQVIGEYKLDHEIPEPATPLTEKEIMLGDLTKRKETARFKELENKYKHLLLEFDLSEKRFDAVLNIHTVPSSLLSARLDAPRTRQYQIPIPLNLK